MLKPHASFSTSGPKFQIRIMFIGGKDFAIAFHESKGSNSTHAVAMLMGASWPSYGCENSGWDGGAVGIEWVSFSCSRAFVPTLWSFLTRPGIFERGVCKLLVCACSVLSIAPLKHKALHHSLPTEPQLPASLLSQHFPRSL